MAPPGASRPRLRRHRDRGLRRGCTSCSASSIPRCRALERSGRVLVLGTPPAQASARASSIAQRALEGFTRSLGKEVGRRGATAQLVYVAPGGEHALDSTLRFLLSPRSAYVSGQVVVLGARRCRRRPQLDWERAAARAASRSSRAPRAASAPRSPRRSRATARMWSALDVPAPAGRPAAVAGALGGEALALDITAAEAPAQIAEHFRRGGIDVVVHNAGVTRDRTLGEDAARALELADRDQPVERAADQRRAARAARASPRAAGSSACPRSSGIAGNAGPDQLRRRRRPA